MLLPSEIQQAWLDATNRFSELVEVARAAGPLTVTEHGQPAVVVAEELWILKDMAHFNRFVRGCSTLGELIARARY